MRLALLAISIVALSGTPVVAAGNVMSSYIGNTVLGSGDGIATRVHYRADRTFDGSIATPERTSTFKGTWYVDPKGQLCRVYAGQLPDGVKNPDCQTIVAHAVGDHWTTQNMSHKRAMSLVAGIH